MVSDGGYPFEEEDGAGEENAEEEDCEEETGREEDGGPSNEAAGLLDP